MTWRGSEAGHPASDQLPFSNTSAVMEWAGLFVWSREDEGCFRAVSRLQSQCHSCKQSDGSALAELTTSALPEEKRKKSEIVSWLVSRPHLGRLFDAPANQPGADMLHMAHNLFCCYHPPPDSVSNSNAFRSALCCCSFVSHLFCLPSRTLRDFRSL